MPGNLPKRHNREYGTDRDRVNGFLAPPQERSAMPSSWMARSGCGDGSTRSPKARWSGGWWCDWSADVAHAWRGAARGVLADCPPGGRGWAVGRGCWQREMSDYHVITKAEWAEDDGLQLDLGPVDGLRMVSRPGPRQKPLVVRNASEQLIQDVFHV
jgi:hypothetical protein